MTNDLFRPLPDAILHWKACDPLLAKQALVRPPVPIVKRVPTAFAALARSITSQQVSLAAAKAIYGRLTTLCGGRVSAARVNRLTPGRLREAGLSRSKASYVSALAKRFEDGDLSGHRLSRLADEAIIETLTESPGIGRWTAQMFLLFHLHRPDVVAPDDWGLRMAVEAIHGVSRDASRKFLAEKASDWSPYGSLASLTLWRSRAPNP